VVALCPGTMLRASSIDSSRSGPPRLERVTHQQHAEFVATRLDLVVQDALTRLHLPVAHAQLVHAHDCGVGGAVGVVHGRAVLRGAVFVPHGEVVAHRVRLAVANHHAENFSARHPRAHPRLHAGLRDRDLVARAVVVVHVRVVRQPALVRAPAHLGGRDAFFVEALDRPGVHELAPLLRFVCDLSITL